MQGLEDWLAYFTTCSRLISCVFFTRSAFAGQSRYCSNKTWHTGIDKDVVGYDVIAIAKLQFEAHPSVCVIALLATLVVYTDKAGTVGRAYVKGFAGAFVVQRCFVVD